MRVFVTGATGNIGSTVVGELVAAGHQALGLCRSREKEAALAAAGAQVLRGSIEDADILASGVAQTDAVIHLAFNHDFSKFAANCEDDRRVIGVLATALAGSDRPLVVTSGTPIADTVPASRHAKTTRSSAPTRTRAQRPRKRRPRPRRTASMSRWYGYRRSTMYSARGW